MFRCVPRLASPLIMICFAVNSIQGGETITDAKFGFTLTLPDGFKPQPVPANAMSEFLYTFVREEVAGQPIAVVLGLEKMDGPLKQRVLSREDVPATFSGKLFQMRWNGLDVNTATVIEAVENHKVITFNTQIPLRHCGIQLKLFGSLDNEEELKTLLSEILTGLKGESNWSTSSSNPTLAEGRDSDHQTKYLMKLGTGLLGGFVLYYFASRTLPRGGVLLMAVLIYWLSWTIQPGSNRQMYVIVGTMRLSGFIGMILGAYDLFHRDRKLKNQTPV